MELGFIPKRKTNPANVSPTPTPGLVPPKAPTPLRMGKPGRTQYHAASEILG